jgi:hypothetical protein
MGAVAAAVAAARSIVITPNLSLEHDPEKWKPASPRDKRQGRLRGDHAQTKGTARS